MGASPANNTDKKTRPSAMLRAGLVVWGPTVSAMPPARSRCVVASFQPAGDIWLVPPSDAPCCLPWRQM